MCSRRFCAATAHPLSSAEHAEGYFSERSFAETRRRAGLSMRFHDAHRPLSGLFAALEQAGLVVEALREPVPDDAYVHSHPEVARWRERPALLTLRARR